LDIWGWVAGEKDGERKTGSYTVGGVYDNETYHITENGKLKHLEKGLRGTLGGPKKKTCCCKRFIGGETSSRVEGGPA